jgi:hypothetical protein
MSPLPLKIGNALTIFTFLALFVHDWFATSWAKLLNIFGALPKKVVRENEQKAVKQDDYVDGVDKVDQINEGASNGNLSDRQGVVSDSIGK